MREGAKIKQVISTDGAPKAIGPYSQAQKYGNFIFVSGQLPINPVSGKMAEGIEAQAKQSMDNIGAILKEAGSSFSNVLKTVIFLKDLSSFKTVNEIYSTYFSGNYPARSTVEVARLPMDAQIEIEVIAAV